MLKMIVCGGGWKEGEMKERSRKVTEQYDILHL